MNELFKKALLLAMFLLGALMALAEALVGRGNDEGNRPTTTPDPPTWEGRLKQWSLSAGALLLAAAIGASVVVALGVIPIAASSGHWPITAWFLNFTMRRSVVMHSFGTEVPPLDDFALVVKGATHYEFGCRPCHGGVNLPQPVIAQQMTPHPPYLPPEIPKWQPDELFYIVKHGVKFTGMPGWPAQQREDEVWAIVAFLLKIPSLTPAEYDALAHGSEVTAAPMKNLLQPKEVMRVVNESCARCHGADGGGRGLSVFPILAGQRPQYLYESLRAFARGERHSGIMIPLAAGLSDRDIEAIADYYAGLPPQSPSSAASQPTAAIARGKDIATRGVPGQGVPACISCHGPSNLPRNPVYPNLAGQYSEYLRLQLDLFKSNRRGGTPYAHLMQAVANRLTFEQARDVSLYYASLNSSSVPSGVSLVRD